MSAELLAQARSGDQDAFARLIHPYRRELELHCYRILGSVHDAEDALQEALLAAWQGLSGFRGQSSVRTWLYRVATNRCLNALRSRSRLPDTKRSVPQVELPEPTRLGEVPWLEPYPDTLIEDLVDRAPGPEARYETKEAVSLAFVTALQLLPPRQRAVLILRDVLGFHATEVARILESSEESVTSALKRARVTLEHAPAPARDQEPPPAPNSAVEQELVGRFVRAFESQDVQDIVALLRHDAWLSMPPLPFEYVGREPVRRFLQAVVVSQSLRQRLVPTRANGQPAFGIYIRDPRAEVFRGIGLLVLGLAGSQISAMTHFGKSVLASFGLPRTLSE